MEYIHKAKAEKTRTKVLSDQMEARRIKNKVRPSNSSLTFVITLVFACSNIYSCSILPSQTGCP